MRKAKLITIFAMAGALALSGCTTYQGETPEGNQEVFVASAYTMGGCQQKLDEEAGRHVVITEHYQTILRSILSYGIEPAFICQGAVQTAQSK